ncbi:MAG: TonB family protein [Nitrospirae bacterium]|nr:TonB family protein [Nitrospirota bacterium]
MASQATVQSGLWFDQDDQAGVWVHLKRTLVWSLALHVVVLVATGLRLPQRAERPLTSVEVSLVSLPAPVRPAESVKPAEPAKPTESAKVSDPKPVPAPSAKPAAQAPPVAPPKGGVKRDVLRDFQLPPDAPKFGDLSPAKSVGQPQQAAKMKSLDIPRVPDAAPVPVAKPAPRSSVSDDLNRELEEELKKIKPFQPAAKLDLPRENKSSEAPAKPVAQQQANVSALKTPETTLKTAGMAGSSSYWARVQSIISSQWEPPPVDMAGQTYQVIVKFRLQRDGMIKDVVVKQTSGNTYFDMAGQRAVLRPRVLPAFPADMTDGYKDIEMVFRVGEPVG